MKALHRVTDRKPFLKFYSQAWFGDTALRGCSPAARGIWTDLLMVMHQDGEPYGYLARDGEAISDAELAQLCGVTLATYTRLLGELETRKVFSRDVRGRIYSRKMVRDAARSAVLSRYGKDGSKHPDHPLRRRTTLKPTLKGDPQGSGQGAPLSTRAPDKSTALTEHPDVPRATPDDLAARDELRAAWRVG